MSVRLHALRAAALLAVTCLLTGQVSAQPALSTTTPGAVTPGKAIDLTLVGQKLDDPLTIWTSFPAKVELKPLAEPKPGQTQRVVTITPEATVGVGIGGLLVGTPEGVSDLQLLMIDDLPSVADSGQNQSPAQAQELKLPVAVDGVSNGPQFDYYRFNVAAGQRVAVEVVAGRLAQDFDPVVRLLDATGRELLLADDDPAIGSDCRFTHTFQVAGQYLLEVRDNQYRPNGRYRLRVGDFPLVTSAYPIGVQAGTTAKVGFVSPTSESPPVIDLPVPAIAGSRLNLGAKWNGGASSGLAAVAVSAYPEVLEVEPNNETAKATAAQLPGGLNGRLETPGDRDYFSVEAKKGQRFIFRAMSRSFGAPTIVKFYIQKADGSGLAESPVSEADEEALVYAFPEDGSYRIVVEDLLKRGGPDYVYRVAIEPAPLFTLALKPDKATRYKFVAAKQGAAISLDVPCARSGYDGPITLSVEGPGGAYQVYNNVIPDKQAATKMLILPPAGFQPGQLALLKIVGKATVDGKEVAATVSTADLLRVIRPQLAYPPAWIDGMLSVAAAADAPPFYTATVDRPQVLVPRTSGQAEFNVKLERKSDQFKDPLNVFVFGGPPGYAFEVKRNGNGPQETYQVLVKGPANAPEGQQVLKVISFAELAGKGQAVVAADLPLRTITPLSVTVAPAGGLVFGNKQKVKLSVARFATGSDADKQPVIIKWKKLPPGVTGPAEVTLPADKDSVDVELVAAADAPAGSIADLTVTATTKFLGQDVTVDSAPLGAEVAR